LESRDRYLERYMQASEKPRTVARQIVRREWLRIVGKRKAGRLGSPIKAGGRPLSSAAQHLRQILKADGGQSCLRQPVVYQRLIETMFPHVNAKALVYRELSRWRKGSGRNRQEGSPESSKPVNGEKAHGISRG
jgi:hypothetical protein